MDGVGTRCARGRDELPAVEVTRGAGQAHPGVGLGDVRGRCIGLGVDGDGADAEAPAGGEHPPGDLPAVGDQELVIITEPSALRASVPRKREVPPHRFHIRKTPKFDVPLIGPLAMADRHIPSTVRVSRGSITPSS